MFLQRDLRDVQRDLNCPQISEVVWDATNV